MAIRRKRVDRNTHIDLTPEKQVIDLPPGWAFTIRCVHSGAEYHFDFASHRARSREPLAEQMRDAIWSLRFVSAGKSLMTYFNSGIRCLWLFLDDLEQSGQVVTTLEQIDRQIIMQFVAWLALQTVQYGKNKGLPWSVSACSAAYRNVKSLLTNRRQHVPESINPNLNFPKNPYPNSNRRIPRREGYSAGEQERIISACGTDLARFNTDPDALSSHQILAVHAVITVLTCGVNMTPLLEMQRDSLRSFLPDRDLLVLGKRRGYTTRTISLPKNTPEETATPVAKMVGDYLRQLQQYTERFISDADEADRPFVFLCRLADVTSSRRRGSVVRFDEVQARNALKSFVNRHALLDDQGKPLKLSIARLRPTFALNYYLRHRDLRKLQQALGHSSIHLTLQRYIPPVTPEAVRNHAFIGQAMVGWATSRDETLAIRLAADGEIPLRNATELIAGGYNTSIARCRNPFREADQVCGKFLACFRCPSMVVFEDDLYRLYSFYFRLLAERPKIPPHQWMKTFGPVIRTIDEQIAVQFDVAIVAEARQQARSTPHPAWRNDAPLI